MEEDIIQLITQEGPLSGQELLKATQADELLLWRTCRLSERLTMRTLGIRYLRLDRRIRDFARLSPSILREFLTYSLVGLPEDPIPLERRTQTIRAHIEAVSRSKSDLAHSVISSLADRFQGDILPERVCFILAGDIVYGMAHDVPRPERSTGKMVNGSDMDIVVVVDNRLPDQWVERLDAAIFEEKTRLLIAPHLREEIDYVVKNLNRVREQVQFDTFKRMVACKILHEGTLLYGSEVLFHEIKEILKENGIDRKLQAMEDQSLRFRERSVELLLHEEPARIKREYLDLFYPVEESEEFE